MVLDFLQIPLTSMRIDRHASCENIVPRIQTSCQLFPPPHPADWSLNPLRETLVQLVLKSFISVFILNNEELENKLTRAPLLGLAKSTCYKAA